MQQQVKKLTSLLFCTLLSIVAKTKVVCLSVQTDFISIFSPTSLDSLRCHPEDQKPDPDIIPPEPTLRTLVYDYFIIFAISQKHQLR